MVHIWPELVVKKNETIVQPENVAREQQRLRWCRQMYEELQCEKLAKEVAEAKANIKLCLHETQSITTKIFELFLFSTTQKENMTN